MSALDADLLAAELAAQGLALPADAPQRLAVYATLLLHWNRRINLVGTHEPHELWRRHLLDCLMLERVPAAQGLRRWLDVGAGAGLPAVPLAIAHPEREVRAVERVAKKATFLRQVARELGLANLAVVHGDAHALAGAREFEAADVVVARAFGPLADLLALGAPLLRAGGELWAMKGRRWETETAQVPAAVRGAYAGQPDAHPYRLGVDNEGVVLVYRRAATTAA